MHGREDERLYLLVGNDDPREIMDTIRKYANDNIIDVNEKAFAFDVKNEGFGLPFSNITPWNLPGDIPEEELKKKIDSLASGLKDLETSIFLIHVPPATPRSTKRHCLRILK